MPKLSLALFSALLGTSLLAQAYPQDLVAVTFSGSAVTLDSRTAIGQVIGSTGFTGHNCMARVGGKLYTTEQSGSGSSIVRFLDEIDDGTGQATRRRTNRDQRAGASTRPSAIVTEMPARPSARAAASVP